MYLPKPNKGTLTPAGTWPAVCYRIVELGTQEIPPSKYNPKVTYKHQVMLSWELQDDECTIEFEGKVRRMTVHRKFTWSMHPKSALRVALESWRGKKFGEEDFPPHPNAFKMSKLIGAPCLIGIQHDTRDGETYSNIASISKLPKGMSVLPLESETMELWINSDLKPSDLDRLSENTREKIKASPEYKELFGGGAPAQAEPEWEGEQEMAGSDVPF